MKKSILSVLIFIKKLIPYILLPATAVFWAVILKNEFLYVLNWWGALLVVGFLFLPMSAKLFSTFTDKGFLFSKAIGLAISSYIFWLLSFLKLFKITMINCWVVVIALGIIISIIFLLKTSNIKILFNKDTVSWILIGESLFLFSLCFWTYLRGFNPRIEGLEKFMDYGFVNSILRSGFVPPKDMWFAGGSINYYYFGQYITAFLTRLSGLKTEISYNIMMAALFAFSMAFCFTIVANLLKGHGIIKKAPVITGGLISSLLVSLGGNLHSFFYGFLSKFTKKGDKYWFPDATRYIGYNPETKDKTIHEFPVYSFVVSDLHAHVINMIFVLTIIGVLIAVFRKLQRRIDEDWQPENRFEEFFFPEMLLLGFLICIFQMSNYWDFPIYLTVTLFVFICAGIRQNGFTIKAWGITAIRFLTVLVLSLIFAIPFNLSFDKIASQIGFSRDHSMPYQLLVLWGYQLAFVTIFFIVILYGEQNLRWKRKRGKERLKLRNEMGFFVRVRTVLEKYSIEDVFTVILCISAVGLIIIPELVYVKDIYSAEHKRANTMFKLTYQAFIMFGLASGYILIRIRKSVFSDWKMTLAKIVTVVLLILPMIYPFYAIPSWYKDMDPEKYESLNGLVFLEKEYPGDYELIYWLRENIQGQPVVLEANGDSYTYNCRISMATGLPTIQGWYTHEWLWRGNNKPVQERIDEVQIIYESDDVKKSRELIDKYQVEYIVIGELEFDKFPDLNEDKLLNFGTVVFERPDIKLIRVE